MERKQNENEIGGPLGVLPTYLRLALLQFAQESGNRKPVHLVIECEPVEQRGTRYMDIGACGSRTELDVARDMHEAATASGGCPGIVATASESLLTTEQLENLHSAVGQADGAHEPLGKEPIGGEDITGYDVD